MAKKRRKRKKHHYIRNFFLLILLVLVVAVIGGVGYVMYSGIPDQVVALKEEADELVAASDRTTFVPDKAGSIYGADGRVITEMTAEKNGEYVTYSDIPDAFSKAMISTEDRKFYEHNGFDPKAMMRALQAYIKNSGTITQGGSTITQQLAKNVFLTGAQTWERKVQEIFIAMDLEQRYTKDDIMEFYLNNIYFANGYYGVKAACTGYFNCDLKDLSLSQIAFLCAIPNSPSYYDPIENIDNTYERRDLMLENMFNEGYISRPEYEQAIHEKIALDLSGNKPAVIHNYVDTFAYHCAAEALMETTGFQFQYDFPSDSERAAYEEKYNDLYAQCMAELYSGKYNLYTSIDMSMQRLLQQSIDDGLEDFTDITDSTGDYEMQSAGVCIDNKTGYVTAIVGGRSNPALSGYTLNRAFQSFRQPGSSIKPLIDYTPAFDKDFTPSSIVEDKEIKNGPQNAEKMFFGRVTIRSAVYLSLNTVAWQMFQDLGPEYCLSFLKNMHFSKIVDDDVAPAVSIGGMTHGVSPLEMASAYAALENDGVYRGATCILQITDYSGNIIYGEKPEETQIYKQESARMMTDIMKGVIEDPMGTAYGLALDGGMPAAGKTGTTDEGRDGWFVGYTRYYTTAIWVGNDTPEATEDLMGATYPGFIWQSFMNSLHEGLVPADFPEYKNKENNTYISGTKKKEKETETESETETETETKKETKAPETKAPETKAPETSAPATEAPATEAPATEAPATEAPATEAPVTPTEPSAPADPGTADVAG